MLVYYLSTVIDIDIRRLKSLTLILYGGVFLTELRQMLIFWWFNDKTLDMPILLMWKGENLLFELLQFNNSQA